MSVELVKILVVSFEKYFDHGTVLEPHYKKSVPPMTMNQDYTLEPVRVSVGFLLEDIPSINEAKNVIEVKLSTTISWNESRAIYHNLKDDQSKNALRDYEKRNPVELRKKALTLLRIYERIFKGLWAKANAF